MTQFMLVRSDDPPPAREAVVSALSPDDELHRAVALHHFGTTRQVWSVSDAEGLLEPLVDPLWEFGASGRDLAAAPFAAILAELVRRGAEFVLWCGDDFEDLPIARTWDELVSQLRTQTASQPADVFVRFCATR